MCDILSATVREHLDSKTLRLVDASWPFVYWNFFLYDILLYRVVNELRNKYLSWSNLSKHYCKDNNLQHANKSVKE